MGCCRVLNLLLCGSAALVSASPPHIIFNLVDDWGWANVGYHRPGFNETQTPFIDQLVATGINLDQHYAHKFCSPSRSSLQSGRLPIHVNVLNAAMQIWNASDPVSGFAGIPRNMTGIAEKLAAGGYATHMAGKWDAGMATPNHTPQGRGYQTSLNYYQHYNDYWTQIDGSCPPSNTTSGRANPIVDLWDTDKAARSYNNSWNCSQTNQLPSCIYEDEIFIERVLSVIQAHDPSTPLFLFWAPHIVHAPLQVPEAYYNKFSFIDDPERRSYAAMVNYLDGLVGRVIAALLAKGMWNDTLWVTVADNGGPISYDTENEPEAAGAALRSSERTGAPHVKTNGANNWPLRGGKMSNWQGGIRVNAFVSGGVLPTAVRNTTVSGFVHIADWYTTFAGLAGVPAADERAAAAGLPPVDGLDLWPLISGSNLTSPRTEVPIGTGGPATHVQALIRADGYKLIVGEIDQNVWTGPLYPNASTSWVDTPYHCGAPKKPGGEPAEGPGGCLFNIFDDPTEHNDLAALQPAVAEALYARILEIEATAFSPYRGSDDGTACRAALERWQGFFGPFLP